MRARTIDQGPEHLGGGPRRGRSGAAPGWLARAFAAQGRGSLAMRIEGKRYQACDCSPGGFRLKRYHRELKARDRIEGLAWVGLFGATGGFVAEVVRTSPTRGLSLRFIEVSSELLQAAPRRA